MDYPLIKDYLSIDEYEKALRLYYQDKFIIFVWKDFLTEKSAAIELKKAKSNDKNKDWFIQEHIKPLPKENFIRYKVVAKLKADQDYIDHQINSALRSFKEKKHV